MDCGNKEITVQTNRRMLGFLQQDGVALVSKTARLDNATIIEPCFIGEDVILTNSTVGPFVSIGKGTVIENSTIKKSIIQTNTVIENASLDNAMIGNNAHFNGNFNNVSIGDYCQLK